MTTLIDWLNATIAFLRTASVTLLVIALVLATAAWAARTRRVSPFSAIGRWSRRWLDPLLAPLDRRLARSGVPAATVPWWAVLGVLVGGAAVVFILGFVRDALVNLYLGVNGGSRGVFVLVVRWTFGVLQLALLVRIITTWIGGAYSAVGRLAFRLTEWFLGPLRGALPTFGPVDISPMVAWLAMIVVERIIVALV